MSSGAQSNQFPDKKSDRTRRRIIESAAALLAERGYSGTRMVDIGAGAELRDASLYYHFASKDELVEEILRMGVQATSKHVRECVDALSFEASPLDRLRTAIRAHLETVLELSDVAAASLRLMSQVPAELGAPYRRYQHAYGTYWNRLLREAADAGVIRSDLDLTSVRLLVIGSLNWVVEWPKSALRASGDLADVAEALILDGLVPTGSSK